MEGTLHLYQIRGTIKITSRFIFPSTASRRIVYAKVTCVKEQKHAKRIKGEPDLSVLPHTSSAFVFAYRYVFVQTASGRREQKKYAEKWYISVPEADN